MKNRIESFQGSTHFRLHYVADSVIAAIAAPGSGAVGNASIIDLGDIAMVVDTFATIQAAEDLKAAAEYITGKPVSYVINTHWHSDHTSGNQVFSPASPIISTAVTREVMDTFARERLARFQENPEQLLQAIDELEGNIQKESNEKLKMEMTWEHASDREYMKSLPALVLSPPNLTFDRQLTIYGSKRSAQLLTFGGGHSQSDTIIYIPQDKILIIGDLVLSKHHPVLTNAHPQDWLDILEQVEQLDIEAIVPGHGEVCSLQELYEVKGYIADIMALVQDAVQSEKSMDEIEVPQRYQHWSFTTYFRSNLSKAHAMITGKA